MMTEIAKILVVDDEADMLSGFSAILTALGHTPYGAANAADGYRILQSEEIDLIFCDFNMPEINGIQFVETALRIKPSAPIIIFTAYGTVERAVEAIKIGAFDFIEKPIDTEKLKVLLDKAIAKAKIYKDRTEAGNTMTQKFGLDNIIGESEPMKKVFEMVKQVSGSDANILLTGESGTGKELIAKSIHRRSSRKNKPFVPVNCGAFPEPLFESELFGYEKGSFTGATRRKIGLLEYSDGGTFFMDEVCELPVSLQVKLLRALQEKNLRRVGGHDIVPVDIRIISASNRNIELLIDHEKMRKDFYYRINVINIQLPPLRERGNDIKLLAEYFLERSLNSSSKTVKGFSDEVLNKISGYTWPGNVRELENVIERAVTLTKSDYILPEDLPDYLKLFQPFDASAVDLAATLPEVKQKFMSEIELKYLVSLLEKHHGNVTKVAEEAGMTRRNIHRLLKNHHIEADNWRKN